VRVFLSTRQPICRGRAHLQEVAAAESHDPLGVYIYAFGVCLCASAVFLFVRRPWFRQIGCVCYPGGIRRFGPRVQPRSRSPSVRSRSLPRDSRRLTVPRNTASSPDLRLARQICEPQSLGSLSSAWSARPKRLHLPRGVLKSAALLRLTGATRTSLLRLAGTKPKAQNRRSPRKTPHVGRHVDRAGDIKAVIGTGARETNPRLKIVTLQSLRLSRCARLSVLCARTKASSTVL